MLSSEFIVLEGEVFWKRTRGRRRIFWIDNMKNCTIILFINSELFRSANSNAFLDETAREEEKEGRG